MKIGIFDSGLGGKLILDAVRTHMPQYDYAYYGDTAHVPYGERSEEEIYTLTKAGVTYLYTEQQCGLVIVACNTSSAESVRRLQTEYLSTSFPGRSLLGVVVPTLEVIVTSECKNILLIGTQRTISSNKYQLELEKFASHINLTQIAAPKVVPHIEAGQYDDALAEILQLLQNDQSEGFGYDGLILGCTHYSVLTDTLRQVLGERVRVFAQTEIIPDKLQMYLETHPELVKQLTTGSTVIEYTTAA